MRRSPWSRPTTCICEGSQEQGGQDHGLVRRERKGHGLYGADWCERQSGRMRVPWGHLHPAAARQGDRKDEPDVRCGRRRPGQYESRSGCRRGEVGMVENRMRCLPDGARRRCGSAGSSRPAKLPLLASSGGQSLCSQLLGASRQNPFHFLDQGLHGGTLLHSSVCRHLPHLAGNGAWIVEVSS